MPPRTLLTAALLSAFAVAGPAIQGQVFRGNIDLIRVYPLVIGPDGRIATGLEEKDFEVLDNGRPAEIAAYSTDRQPITALLLLDMSASMEDRWQRVRTAAGRFVDAIDPVDRLRIG